MKNNKELNKDYRTCTVIMTTTGNLELCPLNLIAKIIS